MVQTDKFPIKLIASASRLVGSHGMTESLCIGSLLARAHLDLAAARAGAGDGGRGNGLV